MAENANKTVNISIDDFQYYVRRDDRMSLIEIRLKEAIEKNEYVEAIELLLFFE